MADGTVTIGGVLYDVTLTPSVKPPDPPDPPDVPTPPVSQGRKRILWHHGWTGPALANLPVDVLASLTTVNLAMCQSAKANTGLLTMPPGVNRATVSGLTAAGVDVFAGVGGSGDGGITITNPGQVSEAMASIGQMRANLGITGVTLDLEGTPGQRWTVDAVTTLCRAIVGSGLKVGFWSALYGGRLAAWGAVAKALGNDLSHWERGLYDFAEAADSRLTNVALGDLAGMRQYVSREDQLVASFMPRPQTPYPNSSPVPVLTGAYAAVRQRFPQVGFSVWEDLIDAKRGWAATRALAKL